MQVIADLPLLYPLGRSRELPEISYPEPDVVVLDKAFRYKLGNTPIQRLHTGTLWAEGPAWSAVGRYLLWSDIPNNVQMRWIADDNRVTTLEEVVRETVTEGGEG